MKQLWSKDYNELHENSEEEWKISSRKNRYKFTMKNGSIKTVEHFCEEYMIKTIIDYGCGSATDNYHFYTPSNVSVYNYDPFVAEYLIRPNRSADMVVCYNVLNIIEPAFFDDVLNDINSLTNKIFVCNIKLPGHWHYDLKFLIEKISSQFKIKEFSYTKDVKYLHSMSLFILSEKK